MTTKPCLFIASSTTTPTSSRSPSSMQAGGGASWVHPAAIALVLSAGCAPPPTPELRLEFGPEVVCETATADDGVEFTAAAPGWDALVADRPMGGAGFAIADFNGDDRLDVYLPHYGGDQLLLQTRSGWVDHSFELLPAEVSGATASFDTTAAAAVDFDGDGDIDIALGGARHVAILENDGHGHLQFVVGRSWQPDTFVTSLAWGDSDGDGDLDLAAATHALGEDISGMESAASLPAGPRTILLENQGAGDFIDASHRLDQDPGGYAYQVTWFDIDDDGDQDLYVTNDFGPEVTPNQVWTNDSGEFRLDEQHGLDARLYGMGAAIADLNSDAKPDLLVSSWGELALFESSEDVWVRTDAARGLRPHDDACQTAWAPTLGDINNDGYSDAFVAYGSLAGDFDAFDAFDAWQSDTVGLEAATEQPDALFLGGPTGRFVDASSAAPAIASPARSRGAAWADLDGNGRLDLIVRSLDRPPTLQMARCGAANWVALDLPPMAAGTRVDITTASGVQTQWLMAGGTGLASSGPNVLHFGLGDVSGPVDATVHWPDGSIDHIDDIPTKRKVTLRRG